MLALLLAAAPVVLAVAAALFFDWSTVRSGLAPPAFRARGGAEPEQADFVGWGGRRLAALALLSAIFWLGVFLPLSTLGAAEPDLANVNRAQLFLLHGVFVLTLVLWYLLGFAATERAAGGEHGFPRQLGLGSPAIWKDLGIGLVAGVGAWLAVLLILIGLGALIWAVGGDEALPAQPPALVPWLAALPLGLRLALSASAGFAEELFFRGLLQPRAGIAFSTALFAMAHVGYGQPLMLVGVTLLSLAFAALVRWRQNIWSAVVAHAVFDALQLTVVIPKALELLESSGRLPL